MQTIAGYIDVFQHERHLMRSTKSKNPSLFRDWGLNLMVEEQRFELWNGFPSTVFKTVAFSHSAIPPRYQSANASAN